MELHTEFLATLQQRLLHDYQLRLFVICLLRYHLPPNRGESLRGGVIGFAPQYNSTKLSLCYQGDAMILHARHWETLNTFCNTVLRLTGITTISIIGNDLSVVVSRVGDRWIRESVRQGRI